MFGLARNGALCMLAKNHLDIAQDIGSMNNFPFILYIHAFHIEALRSFRRLSHLMEYFLGKTRCWAFLDALASLDFTLVSKSVSQRFIVSDLKKILNVTSYSLDFL